MMGYAIFAGVRLPLLSSIGGVRGNNDRETSTKGLKILFNPRLDLFEEVFAFQVGAGLAVGEAAALVRAGFMDGASFHHSVGCLEDAGTVSVILYDLSGKEMANILSGRKQTGQHHTTFNMGELPQGMYILRVQIGQRSSNRVLQYLK